MILYFSGTGNSKALAHELARHTGDEVHDIADSFTASGKRVVWVFPIYSWGLPSPVVDAIERLELPAELAEIPHFMAATCGDDAGLADRQWQGLVEARGWNARGAYTVEMPNTYTMMKGFDVDSPEVVRRKLDAFPKRAADIAASILAGDCRADIIRGRFAWIKSRIIYPGFIRYATSSKPYHATAACIACGKCARECPSQTIKMEGDRPVWNGRRCAMCERCYHNCPVHAIAYGKATDGKGQYTYAAFCRKQQ
ncbi:MAG: EFR1 family ferrodoxin [Muribaculaceae bacterium]|nr:EFR1 family ferrodoxin [Muribaculaceae bacterium]